MLSSASSDKGKIEFNDTYYYLKHQLLYGLSLGIAGFLTAVLVHYRFWQKIALPLLLVCLFLLVLVFTPLGFSHSGASRWLNLGNFSIQPAELLKFSFIIYLAAWLNSKKGGNLNRKTSFFKGYLPLLILFGLIAFLIFSQHSTTTVVIIALAALIVYFISGARLSFVLATVFLGVLVLILLVSSSNYRLERVQTYIKTFFQPEETLDTQSQGYQLRQSLMSIGSGGIWGVGFGKSTIKFKYLPEPIGDSIFAVIAEELGFAGVIFLITIFTIFFIRGIMIAKNSKDQFARLTTIGFISVILIQAFINIAAMSGMVPLTGVPLPFVSYGGTSLAVLLTMSGVIVNISKYTS